jgi:hypothetical protein
MIKSIRSHQKPSYRQLDCELIQLNNRATAEQLGVLGDYKC